MYGATKLDLLTKDFCDGEIRKLTEQKNRYAFQSEEEEKLLVVTLAVWERLKEHVANGEIITINEKKEIVWFHDTDPQSLLS